MVRLYFREGVCVSVCGCVHEREREREREREHLLGGREGKRVTV